MFHWLRKILRPVNERQRFLDDIDALNAEAGGGEPKRVTQFLGSLPVRSGTLAIGDPQYMPGLEIPNVGTSEVKISASLWAYPSGGSQVVTLNLRFGDPHVDATRRKIGQVGIDSAKLVVADKADLDEHWTEIGPDRIGVISTGRNDTILRQLTKRFKLKTVRVNSVRAEVLGPVSESLAREIEDYLKSIPECAGYPFMYFRVQTNNSFDRANRLEREWDFISVGNSDSPLMFVCGTGRGDGTYDVEGEFVGQELRAVSIDFVGV